MKVDTDRPQAQSERETIPDQHDDSPATAAAPSFWKGFGNFVLGTTIWAWFGFLYFTGGECTIESLAIECRSGGLLTTINLPVMIIALLFGLFATVGGLVTMYVSMTWNRGRKDSRI